MKHVRVETRELEAEGMASARVPRQEHPWCVPMWLGHNPPGGRRYEMNSKREAEPDHIRKMFMPLC